MEEVQKAKNYALKLLSFRARSRYEIKSRLKEKGFKEETIHLTMEFLMDYNFVDDYKFAEAWVDNRALFKPMGAWRIKQELKQKGINEEIIDSVLETLTSEKELSLATELALKKTAKGPLKRSKLESLLARRGFAGQIIRQALELLPDNSLL